jgi:hypothetical protein
MTRHLKRLASITVWSLAPQAAPLTVGRETTDGRQEK